ncbi:MAG: thiamine pyrophosphate-binding protein [Bradyrhizobium sp.]|nr:MAG: thiamine pyrophosphate-binding protein [Bradyrhizobium sp.]
METPLPPAAVGDYAHGGDRVAAALVAHGVRFLFTLCGGHISPILVAAKARGIRVVDVRDEATAVFAADAIGRLTGTPGVAAVTAGPGVTNALTALQNAKLAHSPLILIGGAAPTALQGRGALQDIDQGPVVAPFVKWARRVRRVRDLGATIAEAFAFAGEGVPGPVFVECPVDLLYDEATIRGWYRDAAGKGNAIADRLLRLYLERHVNRIFASANAGAPSAPRAIVAPSAPQAKVEAAARKLAAAERPLIVVGSQALVGAGDPARLAEALTRLGAPVYLSGMARGLLGRGHPLQLLHRRRDALREADCVLLAGVPCDFRLDYGRHIRRSATLIAANRSGREARLNRRPDIAAIGDAGDFVIRLAANLDGLERKRAAWLASLRARDGAREAEIATRAGASGDYVNPIALLRAIDRAAGENAIFVADGGDFVGAASYVLRPRDKRAWLDPGVFGTLGVGAGFALAAAMARPEAEIWLILGDGACGWSLAEFESFVRQGVPIIAVVGNDAGWTQIAREQIKMLGDDVGVTLSRAAYHDVAAGFGALGLLVRREDEVEDALARAKAAARSGQPVLINVWLDRSDFREGSISI